MTIREVEVRQLESAEYKHALLIDIRSDQSWQCGNIPGAVSVPCGDEASDIEALYRKIISGDLVKNDASHDRNPVILYCSIGERSRGIAEKLCEMGLDARNLTGGFRSWLMEKGRELSSDEVMRYSRQIILPGVGSDGQKKLKQAKVLIVGAGGLGSPASLYLAAAGVGSIGIADGDKVELSNLGRQIVHCTESVGIKKVESARKRLLDLNPDIEVITYPENITPENITEIIAPYDFIVDGADNFETKFLINDACVIARKPFCHAGILGFEGQVLTYVPGKGPCYRCVFEDIPEGVNIPNCEQAGVIGAMAGIIGCIQALETVKYLLNIGELLTGRLYVLDGLTMKSRVVAFDSPSEECKVCGKNPTITDVKKSREMYDRKAMGSCAI